MARTSKKTASRSSATKKSARKSPSAPKEAKKGKVLSSKIVHHAAVFDVAQDEVIEPSGVKARRDVIKHPGSVVILALDERKSPPSVLLIQQYRYTADEVLWEIPAGRIDNNEDPLAGAKRELAEETGYSASEWMLAMRFYPSPGFLNEEMFLFVARDLRKGKATPEEDEFITIKNVPLPKAVEMVMNGTIRDAKAIAGILWAAQKFHISGKARTR